MKNYLGLGFGLVLCVGIISCSKEKLEDDVNQFSTEQIAEAKSVDVKEVISSFSDWKLERENLKGPLDTLDDLDYVEILLTTATTYLEIITNSQKAINYYDNEYVAWSVDSLDYQINASQEEIGRRVPLNGVFNLAYKTMSDLDNLVLDEDNTIFGIDFQPGDFVNGQLNYVILVYSGLAIPKTDPNVNELMDYDWAWGYDAGPGTNANGAYMCGTVTRPSYMERVGGACEVLGRKLKAYLSPQAIPRMCTGYFEYDIESYQLIKSTYPSYYDNSTKLENNVYLLKNKCLSSNDLKTRYYPLLKQFLNQNGLFPSIYRPQFDNYNHKLLVYAGANQNDNIPASVLMNVKTYKASCYELSMY